MENTYYVYILSSWDNKLIYVGVTNNIIRRVYEHKNELVDGYTKKYHIKKLVYLEYCNDINAAIAREKQIKGWTRAKKNALIEKQNPNWKELAWDEKGILRYAQDDKNTPG